MNTLINQNWWDRNWKWFVPTLCLFLLLVICSFIGLLFYAVNSMMKSSDAYQSAVQQARHNRAVITAIGEPITEGFFTTGSINTNDSSGSANLVIPISGPRGDAIIYVSATKDLGRWKFDDLVVDIEKTSDRIDLLQDRETR